jgi:hypothetical protein
MSSKRFGPGEASYVKKLNLHDTYMLGKRLSPLAELKDEDKLGAQLFQLWRARADLEAQLGATSPLLEAAKRAASQIISAINRIVPNDLDEAMKLDSDKHLGNEGFMLKDKIRDCLVGPY